MAARITLLTLKMFQDVPGTWEKGPEDRKIVGGAGEAVLSTNPYLTMNEKGENKMR